MKSRQLSTETRTRQHLGSAGKPGLVSEDTLGAALKSAATTVMSLSSVQCSFYIHEKFDAHITDLWELIVQPVDEKHTWGEGRKQQSQLYTCKYKS